METDLLPKLFDPFALLSAGLYVQRDPLLLHPLEAAPVKFRSCLVPQPLHSVQPWNNTELTEWYGTVTCAGMLPGVALVYRVCIEAMEGAGRINNRDALREASISKLSEMGSRISEFPVGFWLTLFIARLSGGPSSCRTELSSAVSLPRSAAVLLPAPLSSGIVWHKVQGEQTTVVFMTKGSVVKVAQQVM